MAGARTEAGPMVAVRMAAGMHTRVVRMGAAGHIDRAAADILARGGRAAAGIASVEAVGAGVALAEGGRRARRRWRGRVAGDRVTAVVDTAAGIADLRGPRGDICPGPRAVGVMGDLVVVTAVVVTPATVGPVLRTEVTAARVDPVTTTAETRVVTTAPLAARGMAVLTGTHTEILLTVEALMERR
jgi:hypothetical protein